MKTIIKTIQTQIFYLSLMFFLTPSTYAQTTNTMFGFWGSVTLKGDFKGISKQLNNFKWQIMNQSRTRDDSSRGSRLTENLLFSQVGYQLSQHASVWVGYTHDWIHPLNKAAFQESRVYEDFVWKQNIGDIKFLSRTRMDQRINQSNGKTGYRGREFLKVSVPLSFAQGLSTYVGDEILFYFDKNSFGKQGFSENRILAGFNYQLNQSTDIDLGYLGEYISTRQGNDLFTQNLQANISYKF